MTPAGLSLPERQEALERFLQKYLRRGYQIISHTPTTAELYKPARFPAWLFPEQTRYIDIDDEGRIYVSKA